MSNTTFATSGIIGALLSETSADAKFALGTRTTGNNGTEWVYVQANGAITGAGYVCTYDHDFQAALLSTSNDGGGKNVGVPNVAFADDDYGWIQVYGPAASGIRVAASAAANAALDTTATAGQLDDDGTAGSFVVNGLILTTANGGSAGLAPAILNYPVLNATAHS